MDGEIPLAGVMASLFTILSFTIHGLTLMGGIHGVTAGAMAGAEEIIVGTEAGEAAGEDTTPTGLVITMDTSTTEEIMQVEIIATI